MSIGNLKDSGNQGNNMPFQWKVLQGLQEIANQVGQPLTCVEDSVAICAGGVLLTSTAIGPDTGLDVNIIGSGVTLEVNVLTAPGTFPEDTAHVSGDIGSFILGVRNDTYANVTSADGEEILLQ
jgi:hypothetical protein